MAESTLTLQSMSLKHVQDHKVLIGGEGPPLVWLHGIEPAAAESPLLLALARRRRLIAPLMPGIADLDELEGLHDLHDLALHYDSLLEALGLGKVALAGHGFGAMLAAEIAAHAPGRAEALVLFSPLGLWRDEAPVEDLFALPPPEILDLVWKGAARRPEAPPPADDAAALDRMLAFANTLGGMAKYLWPIPDKGLDRRLYRVTAPTLIVFGEDDAFIPASYAEAFAGEIAGAHASLIEGGHMAAYEDPEATADLIARFLARTSG